MLYPPVADLLKNVTSRYLLVNVVAQRAREIAAEAEEMEQDLPKKPVTMAIEEVAEGKITVADENGNAFTALCDLSARQQAILMAGGLLNYTKNGGQ